VFSQHNGRNWVSFRSAATHGCSRYIEAPYAHPSDIHARLQSRRIFGIGHNQLEQQLHELVYPAKQGNISEFPVEHPTAQQRERSQSYARKRAGGCFDRRAENTAVQRISNNFWD
ncbi:hypothetical protein, partial [Pseudomonas juntendi]